MSIEDNIALSQVIDEIVFRNAFLNLSLSDSQRRKLAQAGREDILASISVAIAGGVIPPLMQECLVNSTLQYYATTSVGLDLEKWAALLYKCMDKHPIPKVFDVTSERFLPLIALAGGFALGWYIGEATA